MEDPFAEESLDTAPSLPSAGHAEPTPVDFHYDPHTPSRDAQASSAPPPGAHLNTVDLGGGNGNIFPDLSEQKRQSIVDGGILEVTVSDPERKGEGMRAYVSYKVNTKTQVGPGKIRQSSVVRRYSDFVWLRDRLLAHQDCWLVPPLPEKAILGRFSPMFVDSRRRGLELFLNRVAAHPHISQDDDVKLFLHGAQSFADARAGKVPPPESSSPAKSRGFMDYFSAITESVQHAVGAGKEREPSKDDITCEGIGAYSDTLETSIGSVHKNIVTLTKKTKEIANAWFDFGFSCTLLGQYETEQEEQHLGNAFAKLGNCADRLSVLMTQKVDSQLVNFQEPFDDFLRQIQAVKEMLKARAAHLATYHSALSTLESKQATLEKCRTKPGKEEKAVQMENEVAEAQRKVDETLHHLQTVTERVFAETARFRQEKRVNFKHIVQDFVRLQIEHARKMQTAWESILPEIEAMPFESQ